MNQAPTGPNVHTDGGHHGAVAGTIHGGVHNNYYKIPPPDASLEDKFASARRFLYSDQATTARRLLNHIIVEDRESGEVCFYWLLAFFSGRTYWELSPEERDQVAGELKRIGDLPRTRWSAGIAVIQRLVRASQSRPDEAQEMAGIEEDLAALPADISTAIRDHLERLIQGSLKDELWHGDVQQAAKGQTARNRRQRVWKFFEPDPTPPRIRAVREAPLSPAARALIGIAAMATIGASGTLGSLVVRHGDPSAVVALVAVLAAAVTALRLGAEWRFREETLRAGNQERRSILSRENTPRPGGFTDQVNQLYLRYLRRYAPTDRRGRDAWLTDAYVPLCRLRNDLVEAYREQRVKADEIKWLVRFQVKDMRRRWTRGELLDPRPNIPVSLRLATMAAVGLAFLALIWVMQSAVRQDVLRAAGAFVALVFSAAVAATLGLRIMAEKMRVRVAEAQREQRLDDYRTEYRRWQRRLADRPTDMEMARWLDCDRRLLLNHAVQEYRLKWSDIQAYASLEAGSPNSRKARVTNGPWRYAHYRLLVFLLTSDGVRQLNTELAFEDADFRCWERTNYRYDAVAAVQVSMGNQNANEFHLLLVNGTDIDVAVTESDRPGADDDPQVLADGAEDATGLRHTLFVLEGVAAEGRRWWKGPASRRTAEVRV